MNNPSEQQNGTTNALNNNNNHHQVGGGEAQNMHENTKTKPKSRSGAAAIFGSTVGFLVAGPIGAVAGGAGAAYASKKEGKIGDMTRSCGEFTHSIGKKAKHVAGSPAAKNPNLTTATTTTEEGQQQPVVIN